MNPTTNNDTQKIEAVEDGDGRAAHVAASIFEAVELAASARSVLAAVAKKLLDEMGDTPTSSDLLARVREAAGLLKNACCLLGKAAGELHDATLAIVTAQDQR
jgi:hypothetical protein